MKKVALILLAFRVMFPLLVLCAGLALMFWTVQYLHSISAEVWQTTVPAGHLLILLSVGGTVGFTYGATKLCGWWGRSN
ncbi:MAG: hypothetical protein A3J62_00585 [Candidatus Buchananbacteria bacterium RIFCSPHIGHO2_02_FULL_38_8]|uniref:Uncharacterized protein n=2 Tax=Candidatus Buchananiibacteriota TaxID=1817903 RepID=A0A1G1Y1I1_9BACT|nr:MAG: hypothetical protein A2731_01120 [Candidatus Buchananbacteria bacterium RIFCSPHIGHO2_01_FULL_39_8]OGY47261.1 MAG: hypothetical protein A3J62_00585 [Candidatus Buchananbacteria bacterium RIFCSPHIGHO2_02_FULL_38_8]